MNLHEESLLKYLLNPLRIGSSTSELILNNTLIARGKYSSKKQDKSPSLSYNLGRI